MRDVTRDGIRFTLAALVAAMMLWVCPEAVRAQDAAEKAIAEQLFRQGRALMDQGRYEEAAEKLEASLEIDPASGTQGSLAKCYEEQGKLASAWAMYTEAATRAEREGNEARATGARTLADALVPRLPRLQIRLAKTSIAPPASPTETGIRIARNGAELNAAILGTDVYVDPGEHTITATKAGYLPFSKTLRIREGERHEIEIPTLKPAPRLQPPSDKANDNAAADPGIRDPAINSGDSGDSLTDPGSPSGDIGRTRRWTGLAMTGTGALVVGAGLIVGASAYSAWNDPFDSGDCDRETLMCTSQGQSDTDTARDRARLADILVGVGGVAVVAGAVLYFTAPKASPKASGEHASITGLSPSLAADRVGMVLSGRF